MPSATITPGSQGTWNQATLIAGASKPAAMAVFDDITSYIQIYPPTSLVDTYRGTCPTDIGNVTALSITYRGGNHGGTTMQGTIGCSHGTYSGGNSTAGLWTTINFSILANHPGGGSWTQADFDSSLDFGVVATGSGTASFTYVAVNLTYDLASSGSFVPLIFSVAALLGCGISLNHMPSIASDVHKKTGALILPHEYASALRAWRLDPRRTILDLGRRA